MNDLTTMLGNENSFQNAIELINELPLIFLNSNSIQFENGVFHKGGEASYQFESENGENDFSIDKTSSDQYSIKIGHYTISVFTETDKSYKLQFHKTFLHSLDNNSKGKVDQGTEIKKRNNRKFFFKCSFSYGINYSTTGTPIPSTFGPDISINMHIQMGGELKGDKIDSININPTIGLKYNDQLILEAECEADHSNRVIYIEEGNDNGESYSQDLGEINKQVPVSYNLTDNILKVTLPFGQEQVFDFNTFPEGSNLSEMCEGVLASMGKIVNNIGIISDTSSDKVKTIF